MQPTLRPGAHLPRVYLYCEPIDFRKSHRGLSTLIEAELGHNPFSGELYAFTNKQRNKIKCVFWKNNGFVLYYYRGVGSFNLKLEEVATTEELVGKANILASGDNAKGFISKGTFATYKVHAKGNTAYKLTNLKQNGNNVIGYSFYSPNDSEKLSAENRISVNKNSVFGFGTTVAGEHTLYIYGNRGVGSFNLKLEEVNN